MKNKIIYEQAEANRATNETMTATCQENKQNSIFVTTGEERLVVDDGSPKLVSKLS